MFGGWNEDLINLQLEIKIFESINIHGITKLGKQYTNERKCVYYFIIVNIKVYLKFSIAFLYTIFFYFKINGHMKRHPEHIVLYTGMSVV